MTDNEERDKNNLNQMTPGGYENTTDQAYTYSMYTETILGGGVQTNDNVKRDHPISAMHSNGGTSGYGLTAR